jgi:chemotaxis protein methyltransferase CheR
MIPAPAGGWSHPAYERVVSLLGERTGLAFPDSRVPDAEAGVRRAMARAGGGDVSDYLGRLQRGAADFEDLIGELTVGETYFFRDPLQFQVIREEILPALVRQRPPGHVLRVWSAGCASGEEAYSLAIALDEAGLGQRALVLATDLSRAALARAQAGVYGTWSLRGVDQAVIERCFRPDGQRLRIHDRLRSTVHFGHLNLAVDSYPSFANGTWRMDLILCRNVLIYLDAGVVRAVGSRLVECLAPGGWLLTAPSDPPIDGTRAGDRDDDGQLETVVTRAGLVFRRPAQPIEEPGPASNAGPPLQEPEPAAPPPPAAPRSMRPDERLERARIAFASGDYAEALALVEPLREPEAEALSIRATANGGDAAAAERLAAAAARRHPEADELHLLHAVLLIDLHRHDEAARAARRAVYRNRSLAMGHFLLGAALVRTGDVAGALKAFRNARDLLAGQDPETPVRFADGQRAGPLAAAAAAELERLARQVAS